MGIPHLKASLQCTENADASVFRATSPFVASVAVTSIKMFLVERVILVRSLLIRGGREHICDSSEQESRITG